MFYAQHNSICKLKNRELIMLDLPWAPAGSHKISLSSIRTYAKQPTHPFFVCCPPAHSPRSRRINVTLLPGIYCPKL